jgi:hypothetical protein
LGQENRQLIIRISKTKNTVDFLPAYKLPNHIAAVIFFTDNFGQCLNTGNLTTHQQVHIAEVIQEYLDKGYDF